MLSTFKAHEEEKQKKPQVVTCWSIMKTVHTQHKVLLEYLPLMSGFTILQIS